MINPKITFKNEKEEREYYGNQMYNIAHTSLHDHRKDWRKTYEELNDIKNKREKPKGHDKPNVEGKYHYRYEDPYDTFHIDCVDCNAPYSSCWTNKDKQSLAYSGGKDHYCCTFNYTYDYKLENGEKIKKYFSKKFVCFGCRNIIKRPYSQTWFFPLGSKNNPGPWTNKKDRERKIPFKWPKCSDCKKHMISVNSIFKPPLKKDVKAWKYMEKNWYDDSMLTYEEFMNEYNKRLLHKN